MVVADLLVSEIADLLVSEIADLLVSESFVLAAVPAGQVVGQVMVFL